ncbi:MAG: CD1290 family small acid-soluble spore protein [Peptostreptococcaceae bacterium]
MNENISNQNARLALKQMRMEIAADYGITHDDLFDMIEYAHNNGIDLQKINTSPVRKKSMTRKPSHLE